MTSRIIKFTLIVALATATLFDYAMAGRADFQTRLNQAALERTQHDVTYDGSYHRLDYPGGDVPAYIGVCTDVVIRSLRSLGIDLQQLVHVDMKKNFSVYPRNWGLKRPDSNIDHRRVPNLQTFFKRAGAAVGITKNPMDYHTGDLVTWMLPDNLPHIGIVVAARSSDGKRPMIVHNIGAGPKSEDILFHFPITGHYRYRGPQQKLSAR